MCLAGLIQFLSCVQKYESEDNGLVKRTEDIYPITVEMELPRVAADSRSAYTDEDLNRITDLNIFMYHDGILLSEYCCYYTDMSSLMLSFPIDKDVFNIYMVGNVGRLVPPEDESEIGDLCYVADDYDDFKADGFPVANVFPDYEKGSLASFRLKRLVGQYNISLKPSAVDARYEVKDVRLMNCALDVYPFGCVRKASEFATSSPYGEDAGGDYLTADDITRLNRGEKVSICFIENLQGELLPYNDDRRKKIPSSLEALEKGLSHCCTYMEITADITTQSARYKDAKYRFYLGQNETTDFSIKRNTIYDVTLDFSQNMVSEQEWRIEADAPQVNELILSKEVADVVYAVDDHILMSGPKMKVSEDSRDESDPESCAFSLTDVVVDGKECQKLTFHTDRKPDGFYTWGMNYRNLADKRYVNLESVEKYNDVPLLKKSVTVYVYDKVFPVFFRIGTNDSAAPYQLEALTDAPVNFDLALSANLSVDAVSGNGTNSYKSAAAVTSGVVEGFKFCAVAFPGLYNGIGESDEKPMRFRRLDITVGGKISDHNSAESFYMGTGGEVYWGPGADLAPQKFSDLTADASISASFVHSCPVAGCVRYEILSGNVPLFRMAPEGLTCGTVHTTGTSNSLSYDMSEYGSGRYLPFYIVNGGLEYSYPVTLLNEEAKYLDDSGRKSIVYQMYGPGRDVFYPNGAVWGDSSEMSPSPLHKFGYTAGLVKQFFGNIHTWQIYQDYECQFFMTINGCTVWPGASKSGNGFRLTYNL